MKVPSVLSRFSAWRRTSHGGAWWGRLMYALAGVDPGAWMLAFALFACSIYYALQVRPLEVEVEGVRQQALALSRLPDSGTSDSDDPATRLAAFHAAFPHAGDLPDAMQTLYDNAQAEGLVLERGEYRMVQERGERYMRYEVSLPVKGTYPQLRRFLAKAVAALPTLAVDEVQFSRAQIADALVDCRLSLSLYLLE